MGNNREGRWSAFCGVWLRRTAHIRARFGEKIVLYHGAGAFALEKRFQLAPEVALPPSAKPLGCGGGKELLPEFLENASLLHLPETHNRVYGILNTA